MRLAPAPADVSGGGIVSRGEPAKRAEGRKGGQAWVRSYPALATCSSESVFLPKGYHTFVSRVSLDS